MKTLVITEKPSVARDIAKVLNCTKTGEGYIFNDEYIISWAIGHLVTLCEPEDYDPNLKKWDIVTLPIIPSKIKLKPIKNTKKQLKVLNSLMNSKEVDKIICATDSGREGELIFRYIYEITKCKKEFFRLWISSLTNEAIKEGFLNLKPGSEYDNLYCSAKCRAEADWLVGINATRAFTIKFNNLLSIGRVQTPTLSILVNRQKEIERFVPEEYSEVEAVFKINETLEQYKGTYINSNNITKILDKEEAKNINKTIKNKEGKIEDVTTEIKKQSPPLLYDLTELQRDCNKKYGYSAQKTLDIAQTLYEKRKLITYPRTDSRYLSSDITKSLKTIISKISSVNLYSEFCKFILENDLKITKRIVDDSKISDHHAIIPTSSLPKIDVLSKDEFNVYNLIIRRFLAVFYPEFVYSSTKILTKVLEYSFITKGTTIIKNGWTILNETTDKENKNNGETLPNVLVGQLVTLESSKILNKKTKPPKSYTEATLLSAMENSEKFVEDESLKESLKKSGLGTPATRASIIEKLIKIGYVERKGKTLIPTKKGVNLIEVVPYELKSPETTGKWEKGLYAISNGDMEESKFMSSINRYVNYILNYVENNNQSIAFEKEKYKIKGAKNLGKCLCCDGVILENTKAFFCSNWKEGCKFTIWKNALANWNLEISTKNVKELLEKKEISHISLINPENKEIVKGKIIFSNMELGKLDVEI